MKFTKDELLVRILDIAARVKQREDMPTSKVYDLRTRG